MSGVKATAKGASEKKPKLEKSTAEGVHSLQHGDYWRAISQTWTCTENPGVSVQILILQFWGEAWA